MSTSKTENPLAMLINQWNNFQFQNEGEATKTEKTHGKASSVEVSMIFY